MNWLIIIYSGSEIHEIELAATRQVSIGSGKRDTLRLDARASGLMPTHITLTGHSSGVRLSSAAPVKAGGSKTSETILSKENIVQITATTSLAVFQRSHSNTTVSLSQASEVTIGRSARSDISLPGAMVSSNHAIIRKAGSTWEITDKGSRNGTYVNGKRIDTTRLKDNALIFISGWKIRYTNNLLIFENILGSPSISPKLTVGTTTSKQFSNSSETKNFLHAATYPYFQRSPRLKLEAETHEIEILSPPNIGAKPSVSWLTVLLPPVLMVIVMLTVVSLMETASPMMLAFTLPMSAISVVIAIANYNSQTKKWNTQTQLAKDKYAKHLEDRDKEITAAEAKLLRTLETTNPGAKECISIATRRDRRLWERTPNDDDFLTLRVGTGQIHSNVNIKIPQEQLTLEENPLLAMANKLKDNHRILKGIPVTAALNGIPSGLIGSRKDVLRSAWSILLGAATHHAYDDVKIAVIFPEREANEWDWLRWLPHCWDENRQQRFIACRPDEAGTVLRNLDDILKNRARNISDSRDAMPEIPHYFIILADKTLVERTGISLIPNSSCLGMSVVYAYGDMGHLPGECSTIIECGGDTGHEHNKKARAAEKNSKKVALSSVYDKKTGTTSFIPDKLDLQQMDSFARSLAPVRFRALSKKASMPDYIPLLEGLGVNSVEELDVLGRWSRSRPFQGIAAPIGIRENGEVFSFDIHEKGMGPHGIVAGATRWGKSETLTTWLLSMALNFHPQEVSFVLIDFKGDGLSGILMELPHVAGKISNVNDITSIERNLRSLRGELLRRQRVFMDTKQENIHRYQEAFRSGRVEKPMPYLIIVIDEFAELKTQFPDQMNNFIQIARVGGSLGIYMVLATQSPGGGIVSGQVSANSRFRISLKTAEAGESKDILGTTDAFEITTRGRAYIKVGNNEVYEQVQTFFSKAPYRPTLGAKGPATKINIIELDGSRIKPEVYDKTIAATAAEYGEGRAVAQHIKDTATRANIQPARQVWTEPLPQSLALSSLLVQKPAFDDLVKSDPGCLSPSRMQNDHMEVSDRWNVTNEGFAVTVGLVDDPEAQTQYPLVLDFAADGHHAIYGAPGSGKTEFIRTALLSAAMDYAPDQIQFAALDFGTWGLKIFEGLPHTLLVADGNDKEKISQAEQFFLAELESRKGLFSKQGVGTLEAYRDITGENLPAILIAIDNMASLYNMYPDFIETISTLAREGGSLGIYLLMTTGSQGSFMYRLAQYIKVNLTLQLTDKGEYRQLVGGSGKAEPGPYPGRGFVKGPLEFQTALCAEGTREADRVKHLRDTCAAIMAAWSGEKPSLSRVLSGEVSAQDLVYNEEFVQIGYDKTGKPYGFDINEMNGCVVSGAPGSGKTNILGWIALALSKDPATTVYIYEQGENLQAVVGGGSEAHPSTIITHNGADFDEIAQNIFDEYNQRKQNARAWLDEHGPKQGIEDGQPIVASETWQRIVILLDDFTTFYDEISDETADILEEIMSDGASYKIFFYIAGDKDGLTRFFNLSLPALKLCLAKGNAVALGGNLREYGMFANMHDVTDGAIGPKEGYVIHGGSASAIKIANVKEV